MKTVLSTAAGLLAAVQLLLPPTAAAAAQEPDAGRLRVVIETDAGGDPDDEQSLVRFLLYANEWDVEGIIANRAHARDGENRNSERTGPGIVRRLLAAYGDCHPRLIEHDPRFPTREALEAVTVSGDNDTTEGVNLLLAVVDRADPRPIWYADWGTDHGAATNNLRRALDRVLEERGPEGYARFKSRLRLASADAFGPHTTEVHPPFPLWVDTFRPALDGRRWYHRFPALTARAGGFDLERDVRTGHGPLGALYPTNTTHWAKEGDSMTFLYLVPNGLNHPWQPGWGGWGGRYGPNETLPGRPYFWANRKDAWQGSTHRDHTLGRWAEALQNDFRARLDWCVAPRDGANHPPIIRVRLGPDPASAREFPNPGLPIFLRLSPGESVFLTAVDSSDPDGDPLTFRWEPYPEAGTYRGPVGPWSGGEGALRFAAPEVTTPETVHLILSATDSGTPPLTRYARVVVSVDPQSRPVDLERAFVPPPELAGERGHHRSPLQFRDGSRVETPADWNRRRAEILGEWEAIAGRPPGPLRSPTLEVLESEARETFTQHRVRVPLARDVTVPGWLLIPAQVGPMPAVVVPFYEPETSAGLNSSQHRDYALQLARRGFVALAIGSPGGDARKPEMGGAICQPLLFLAHAASNARAALAARPEVDPTRIGLVGHSYGGKWALFAAAWDEGFACTAVSDPGIAFDEARPGVNYWEPWYLGRDPGSVRSPGLVSSGNPRTGAYRELVAAGHDLHEVLALTAPRPLLVSGGSEDPPQRWQTLNHLRDVHAVLGVTDRVAMTHRAAHDPDADSNAAVVAFLVRFLGDGMPPAPDRP
ncbi:MAG: DUF1593 domain-containing protein [Verrucomicrobiae bacterium]|nr:DUF1593 domain-containing protein [Verrucomicrobiae bacterium]